MTELHWHGISIRDVEQSLHTCPRGLPEADIPALLVQHGSNALPEPPRDKILEVAFRQFRSPLVAILIIAGIVTVALGEFVDSAVIACVVLLNGAVGFAQERRAEESVRSLMRLLSPRAKVVRDHREHDIDSKELVPGDLIMLESGDRVPADARLIAATALRVDESLLTGESVPITKTTEALPLETEVADRIDMVYAGTTISSGRGRGYVVGTGANTELGAIASEMRHVDRAPTPLELRLARFARVVGVIVAIAAAAAFGLGVAIGEPPAQMFMTAVALAVATVPEGLPVAFTITMAVGVRKMARRNVIVRRLPSVETLGSTTIIGSDKTGTLTLNEMSVQRIWTPAETVDLVNADLAALREFSEPLRLTLLTGVLASEAEVTFDNQEVHVEGDPTEAALVLAAVRFGFEPDELRAGFTPYAEIPFEPHRQYSAVIVETNGEHVTFAKGAPERVLAMSDWMLTASGVQPVDPDLVHSAAQELASRGLRVLAMAYRPGSGQHLRPPGIEDPDGLVLLGLQGMADQPRPGAREAIASCRAAGIRVAMITGDHAATARSVAAELGIDGRSDGVVGGAEIAKLDESRLNEVTASALVYARVAPEQKLEIVHSLQAQGHVVAITGDGVNDAPALRAADIGIAMGKRGTDVAKEAADMVLADDNFVSITAAIEEGRATFANIRNATFFLLSTNGGELFTILAALGLRWELPLLAAQMLWLNLATDSLQVIGLAFEPHSPATMRRPPRPVDEGLLPRLLWERIGLCGALMAVASLGLFWLEQHRGSSLETARSVMLTTMVLFQSFQVANARSSRRSIFRMNPLTNPVLLIASSAALAIHAAALYLPPTQYLLRVEPISWEAWARSIACAATILIAVEIHKLVRRRPDDENGTTATTPRPEPTLRRRRPRRMAVHRPR